MLRNLFVLGLLIVGITYALRGPFGVLLLYLGIAYFRPEAWLWDDWARSLPLSWIVGVYLLIATLAWRTRLRFDLRAAVLVAFLGQTVISTLLSPHAVLAMPYLQQFGIIVLTTYLLTVLTTDVARYRLVVLVIGLSLAFEGAKQGWAQLAVNPGGMNRNEHLMLGDNNGVAVGMLMLVPVLLALARSSPRRWERRIHQFFAVGVLLRAVGTYSRGGFLAAIAMGAVYFARSRRKLRAAAAVIMAAVIVLTVFPDGFWQRMHTIETGTEKAADDSIRGRWHYWRTAIAMANDHPLFGVGHNAYRWEYDRYDTSGGEFGQVRAVHSSWLGVLADEGYPGLLLYVGAILLAFGACRRAHRVADREGLTELGEHARALQTALIPFIVGSTFVTLQYTEILWHFLGLSMVLNRLAVESEAAAHVGERVIRGAPATVPGRLAGAGSPVGG